MTDATHKQPSSHEHRMQLYLEKVEGLTFIAALAMFVLSITALGWLPAKVIEKDMAKHSPVTMKAYSELELLGRHVYGREGCAYCHTQQVRSTQADQDRFGPVSQNWEYRYDYPHLLGTRRIGPDLSREANTRTDTWQYAHLYNPRYTVPQSIMPGYPWLFDESENGTIKPNREGRALVAYLNYLGRARLQENVVQSGR
jgi:cbb3-type cytochrome c oxidase subunit II